MTWSSVFARTVAVLVIGASPLAQEPPHVVTLPDDVKWGPASPKLPPGAQFALLAGDPSKLGVPYVFRAKLPDGFTVPPHWHPADENVTVVRGTFILGFGKKFDKDRHPRAASRVVYAAAERYAALQHGER